MGRHGNHSGYSAEQARKALRLQTAKMLATVDMAQLEARLHETEMIRVLAANAKPSEADLKREARREAAIALLENTMYEMEGDEQAVAFIKERRLVAESMLKHLVEPDPKLIQVRNEAAEKVLNRARGTPFINARIETTSDQAFNPIGPDPIDAEIESVKNAVEQYKMLENTMAGPIETWPESLLETVQAVQEASEAVSEPDAT